ncbi:cAMP-dependent protein kinase inhibitor beta-like isoform X2 [Culicoides brevitarsis]|uniref:cAMP-dependent protein kinase inhibitor beta-like isoform X2 n=1 Tax=Culicoides brevitarsis TaxID=469753 RepID=UPI00307C06D0
MNVVKVLKATMDKQQQQQSSSAEMPANQKEIESEFYTTGRIGRRNALPDILAEHCTTSTADLPDNFSALTTQETPSQNNASSSQSGPSEPVTEVSSNKT